MPNPVEKEIRKSTIELQLLEQTAEAIQTRINMVNAATTDLTYAKRALDGLAKETSGSELRVPIGGGYYIKTKLENPNEVLVQIGAGISIEKDSHEAEKLIRRRLETLDKTRISLTQQLGQVAKGITEGRKKVEELMAALQEAEATENV